MVTMSAEELDLLPTDEDVAFYRQHGWYISKRLFTDQEIDAAVAGSERFYTGETDFPPPNGLEIDRGWIPAHGDNVLRKNDYSTSFNRELHSLIHKPVLGAVAARLAGESIRLWHDQLLFKPPSSRDAPISVGWHTDRQYWMCCTSENMLTAWIPFHATDKEIGTITMIDGSHRWPRQSGLDFFSSDLEGMKQKFNNEGRPIKEVPMLLPKGHVSFHHCRTIHGSGPNLSDRPRRAIAVHLQDGPNRYQEYRFSDGQVARHRNVEYCRRIDGIPDFTDPVICPELAPQPGS